MTYRTVARAPLEPPTADHRHLALGAHVTFRLKTPAAVPATPAAATAHAETLDPYPAQQLLGHNFRAQQRGRALPHREYTPHHQQSSSG